MYLRKSTDDKFHQVRSILDQKAELWELVHRDELDIVDVFVEKRSAKSPGRPVFNEMMERMKAGEANGIIAWHPDRISRNALDTGHILYFVDTNIIRDLRFPTFTFQNTASGKSNLAQMFTQSKYYVDNLSETIRRGKRRKVAEGLWPGPAPLGYLTHPKKKVLVPDPDVALHVQNAFKHFATGNYTLWQIAGFLNDAGVKGIQGKTISPSTTQRMLQNPVYYGVFRYKGELRDGVHEPLVTKKLFDRCQRVMSKRSRPKSKGLKPFLYRGLIRCSECGGMVTSETSKGHIYLHCSKRKQPCKHEYRPSVREEDITRQIEEMLFGVSLPDDWVDGMLDRLGGEQDRLKKAADARRAELEADRDVLRERRNRALEDRLDGFLPKDDYRRIEADSVEKRRSIDAEIDELERQDGHRLEPLARFLKASKQAKYVASGGSPEEKRDWCRKIGSNPKLVARTLMFSPRGAWQHVEKSTLLVPAPGSDMSEPGTMPENTFAFSQSGGGGIRTHGDADATAVFKTAASTTRPPYR